MTMRIPGILVLLSLCLVWPVCVSASPAGDVSNGLTEAFQHGRAAALQSLFPVDGRVHLAIAGVDISPGNYSAKQAVALLQQAFQRVETQSFTVNSRSGAVRGEWVVRIRSDGSQKKIVLYVSVQTKEGKQTITSIQGN
jgi:hypothetical protein